MFCKNGVLRNFTKFTGKQSLIFNKATDLKFATLLKKRLLYRCFPVNFAKFLRTPFLTEHLRWLLLHFSRGVNLFSFLYTLIWFELKCIAKCLCEDPNVIFLSNWLVVYSLPPAMSSAQTYYEAFNIRHFPYCPPLKKSFHRGTNSFGKLIVGGGSCSTWLD